jgi:hypothetical protein
MWNEIKKNRTFIHKPEMAIIRNVPCNYSIFGYLYFTKWHDKKFGIDLATGIRGAILAR